MLKFLLFNLTVLIGVIDGRILRALTLLGRDLDIVQFLQLWKPPDDVLSVSCDGRYRVLSQPDCLQVRKGHEVLDLV